MCMWQSQAFTGALSFAGSVPLELGTCCALLSRAENPAVAAAIATIEACLIRVRRPIMSSSRMRPSRAACGQYNPQARPAYRGLSDCRGPGLGVYGHDDATARHRRRRL